MTRLNRQLAKSQGEKPTIRKHRPDYRIILYTGLLVLIGLIILFAISPYQIERLNSEGGNLNQSYYMLKQVTYLLVGIVAFVGVSLMPFKFWEKYRSKLLLTAVGLCLLLTLLGAIGLPPALCHNGACRWFDVGFGTFQPSELLKFALLIFTAMFIAMRTRQGKINDVSETLMPLAVLLITAIILVVGFQKDMGTGITILGSLMAMIFASGIRLQYLLVGLAGMMGVGLMFVITSAHRMERVMTMFAPGQASDASNYHIEMASVAIGSGGFLGRGLGNGVQAFGYLPEALNDSIFAVLGETFGFVGLIFILALFVALLLRIIRVAERSEDVTMRLITYGVFGWVMTHVVVNVGAMTGIFPLTGVTLPFLSFGGTSLLFIMMALGLVYQISKYGARQPVNDKESSHETTSSRRRVGRARHASSSRNQRAY